MKMKIVVLLMLVAALATAAQAQNLIVNPGFDVYAGGTTEIATMDDFSFAEGPLDGVTPSALVGSATYSGGTTDQVILFGWEDVETNGGFSAWDSYSNAYAANSGDWSDGYSNIITNVTSMGSIVADDYVLSGTVRTRSDSGGFPAQFAAGLVLDLYAGNVLITPDAGSIINPTVEDNLPQLISRSYSAATMANYVNEDLFVQLGIAWVEGAPTGVASFDDMSLVPEPATMLLLGLGGLVLRRRRK